ncbi:hypothetical protein [Vulcanisaeta thermophila]|uniref:hypothetical protein n=1 Tax=Vulcanisaeta thermophila TaxID=867917 RepID=UPI0008531BA9|nr:hypothetical protein [Vulcanisaeta thermophila]
MSVLIARKVIEEWLMRRGCKVEEELSDREVVFIEGNNRIYVRIAHEEFPTESFIVDELSNVMKNRLRYNKAYLALPMKARGLINGKLFRSQWVGVYLYDLEATDPDKSVEELIPSIPIQTQMSDAGAVISRLTQLEEMVKSLQESLSQLNMGALRSEIQELRNRVSRVENMLNTVISRVEALERNTHVQGTPQGTGGGEEGGSIPSAELPDYLSNNPWIEVLRRRGGS